MAAALQSSGDEIRQPGGVFEGDFEGERWSRSCAICRNRRRVIWGIKSPGIDLGRKRPERVHHSRDSRLEVDDDDIITNVIPFFLFSVFPL